MSSGGWLEHSLCLIISLKNNRHVLSTLRQEKKNTKSVHISMTT